MQSLSLVLHVFLFFSICNVTRAYGRKELDDPVIAVRTEIGRPRSNGLISSQHHAFAVRSFDHERSISAYNAIDSRVLDSSMLAPTVASGISHELQSLSSSFGISKPDSYLSDIQATIATYTIEVQSADDSIELPISTCWPNSSLECNLRSAWAVCSSFATGSDNHCDIKLPVNLTLSFNTTLGSLVFPNTVYQTSIQIIGSNSSVSTTHNEALDAQWVPTKTTSFPYTTGTIFFGDVESANLELCGGEFIKLSLCNDSSSDTSSAGTSTLTLYSGSFVITTGVLQESCGYQSEIEYYVPLGTPCADYAVEFGCGSLFDYCQYTVHLSTANISSPQFISYFQNDLSSAIPALTITDLSIKNFSSPSYGAAIAIDGHMDFRAERVYFENNVGLSGGSVSVFNNRVEVTFENTRFQNCSVANNGGCVYIGYNVSHVTMDNSTVYFAAAKYGGAVFVFGSSSDISIRDSIFSELQASEGGALYFNYQVDNVHIKGSRFDYCQASNAHGGAIYVDSNSKGFLIENTAFSNSVATIGSAMAFNQGIQNISIVSCAANDMTGSAFYFNADIHDIIVDRLIVQTSTSSYVADGNYYGGVFSFVGGNRGIQIRDSNFTGCSSDTGGGVGSFNNNNQDILLSNLTVSDCWAEEGGGFYFLHDNSNITMDNIIFSGVSADYGGGVLLWSNRNSDITIRSSQFLNCFAQSIGGCIDAYNSSHFLIEDCVFEDFASSSDGGAINFNQLMRNVVWRNVIFRNGKSLTNGGAAIIGSLSENIVLENIIFADIEGNYGGCLFINNLKSVTLSNVTMTNCTAHWSGGAIYVNSVSGLTLVNSTIANSTAESIGGGIYVKSNSPQIELINVDISYCNSSFLGGAATFSSNNANVRIVGSTFRNNYADNNGGALYFGSNNTQCMLAGLSIVGNVANDIGGGVYIKEDNYQFSIMDLEGYQYFAILETEHPYQTHYPVNSIQDVIFSQNVSAPGAVGFVINFDSQTAFDGLSELKIYDSIDKQIVYWSSDTSSYYPGVEAPSLRISGDSYYVEMLGPANSLYILNSGFYGFKLYSYPVMNAPLHPTVFQTNKATSQAGGLFMFYANMFSVVLNTIFENNAVLNGDGGGIYIQVGNGGNIFERVAVINNEAHYNGGGLSLLSGQFGTSIWNSSVANNRALNGFGGGVYIGTGNGEGVLGTGNEIVFNDVGIFNNTAQDGGGGIYLAQSNSIDVTSVDIVMNKATNGDGGGISSASVNTVSLTSVVIASNVAHQHCGGGLTSADRSIVSLNEVQIGQNNASTGGGMCIKSSSQTSVSAQLTVFENSAALVGGGAYFASASYFSSSNWNEIKFSKNYAVRGSAMAMYNLEDVDIVDLAEFGSLELTENVATVGGTVYWVYNEIMTSPPLGLNSSSIVWLDNQAPYGEQWATQATKVLVPDTYEVTIYGAAVSPAIQATMHDYYGQFIPLQGQTAVSVVIGSYDCAQYPHLSGANAYGSGAVMENGQASFDSLEMYCSPNGNFTAIFTAELGVETTLPVNSLVTYYIKNSTFVTFRGCVAGEYDTGSQCAVCPLSTFSLQPNSHECSSCQSTTGVSQCMSNQIYVQAGYWRRYPTSAAVMACFWGASSCLGGNATGEALCAMGYEGPLCAVCSQGYFSSDNECKQCSPDNSVSPMLIVVLVLVVIFLSLVMFVLYRNYVRVSKKKMQELKRNGDGQASTPDDMFRKAAGMNSTSASASDPADDDETLSTLQLIYLWLLCKYEAVMVKLKIVVCTFQVITSTTTIFSVHMPSVFTKFENSFQFMNLSFSSLFPMGCQATFSFIDSLLWTTLAPIGISLLLWVGYCWESWKTDRQLKRELLTFREASEAREVSKSRYLNLFFYLTYLVLPSVTTTIFQMFICTQVDPDNEDSSQYDLYLTADMSISCQSQYYKSWIGYAVVMILVYPIGIPLLYFSLLYLNRQEIIRREIADVRSSTGPQETSNRHSSRHSSIADSEQAYSRSALSPGVSRLAFLWQSYKPQFWYWEIVEATRRIMLTAVLSVAQPGTSQQSVLSVLLALLYIKVYSSFHPYGDHSDDVLAETGQFQIFFTFFAALVLQNELLSVTWDTFLGVLLAGINMVVIVLTFYYGMLSYWEDVKSAEQAAEADKQKMRDKVSGHLQQAAESLQRSAESNDHKSIRFAKKSVQELQSSEHFVSVVQRRQSQVAAKEENDPEAAVKKPSTDSRRTADVEIELSTLSPMAPLSEKGVGSTVLAPTASLMPTRISSTSNPLASLRTVEVDSDDENDSDDEPV